MAWCITTTLQYAAFNDQRLGFYTEKWLHFRTDIPGRNRGAECGAVPVRTDPDYIQRMFDPRQPFVLLDDVAAGTARLFSGIERTVRADHAIEVAPALAHLSAPGNWAGFAGFEAGYALEPRLAALGRTPPPGQPLLWFGAFGAVQMLDDRAVVALLGDTPAGVGPAQPAVSRTAYDAALEQVQALIGAGDIYQANLTFPAAVATHGHPMALYRHLRAGSRAPYGALVHTGDLWLLSFSPELFFRLAGRRLTAKPMKGTAVRGSDAADDAARAATLAADPKNRAENLMIVDLLRNDLARVAVAGSVAVPALFEIETYPTVLQMTSTVTATLRDELTAGDVLRAIFPCGSVTGAPKIRAMEVIAAIEPTPRGAYTGSIGAIDADGNAVFNVAIRTLVMTGPGTGQLGLGSGIVADSDAASEWEECLAKAAFLGRSAPPDLIETMRVEDGHVALLELHLARMAASAAFLGSAFYADAARAAVDVAAASATLPCRLRLLSSPSGALAVQLSPLPHAPTAPVEVVLTPLPVPATDWRLRHKTTDRAFYDAARRTSGAFECLFVAPDGALTEGSFTTLFVPRDGKLLTPPLSLGLLPGVLRQSLLASGAATEAVLAPDDLAQGFFIGNALRGLIGARLTV